MRVCHERQHEGDRWRFGECGECGRLVSWVPGQTEPYCLHQPEREPLDASGYAESCARVEGMVTDGAVGYRDPQEEG